MWGSRDLTDPLRVKYSPLSTPFLHIIMNYEQVMQLKLLLILNELMGIKYFNVSAPPPAHSHLPPQPSPPTARTACQQGLWTLGWEHLLYLGHSQCKLTKYLYEIKTMRKKII